MVMRFKLGEGEWLMALDKGVAMINSCEYMKKHGKTEAIIIKYLNNLLMMSPFSPEKSLKQLTVKLEACTELWIDTKGQINHNKRYNYGVDKE